MTDSDFVHFRDLFVFLKSIRASRKTGALTIHFSQGGVSGTAKWEEKSRPISAPVLTTALHSRIRE
jgi:hypothetical protein